MSKNADLIITGKVFEQNSNWNETQPEFIHNNYSGRRVLKGNNNSELFVVSYPGGEVGTWGELYSHIQG